MYQNRVTHKSVNRESLPNLATAREIAYQVYDLVYPIRTTGWGFCDYWHNSTKSQGVREIRIRAWCFGNHNTGNLNNFAKSINPQVNQILESLPPGSYSVYPYKFFGSKHLQIPSRILHCIKILYRS
jgi:hypothetical protein